MAAMLACHRPSASDLHAASHSQRRTTRVGRSSKCVVRDDDKEEVQQSEDDDEEVQQSEENEEEEVQQSKEEE
jgi:hypothetical protein